MLDGKYKAINKTDLLVRKDGKWYWQKKSGMIESWWGDSFWKEMFAHGSISRIETDHHMEYNCPDIKLPEKAIIGDPVVIPVQEEEIYKSIFTDDTYAIKGISGWRWNWTCNRDRLSRLGDSYFTDRVSRGSFVKVEKISDKFDGLTVEKVENFDKYTVYTVTNNGVKQFFWSYASTVGAEKPETTVKEEVMKKETAVSVAKFCGNLALRGLNYWVATPAINIARPVLSSVRYVVFLTTIVGLVYGYNNPDVVKKAVKSCIPKVTIESPEIMR